MKKATVIIPAYNDFEWLNKQLVEVVGDFEIIIIDNSERPLYQNPPFGTTYLHGFRYVLNGFAKQLRMCPSMMRELGWQYATTDMVIFVPVGTTLRKGWFEKYKATGKF